MTIRIVVVDDHEMFADSLRRLLAAEEDLDVVAVERTATEGVDSVRRLRPDVVIMDYAMPDLDGAVATRLVLGSVPEARVIMLTGSERVGSLAAAMEAGCSAWIRKTRAVHDLVDAVRAVDAGVPFSSERAELLPPVDELVVHYQPVVQLQSGRVEGFEALVRWARPDGRLAGPGEFLPVAEETGYVLRIGRRVGELVLEALARWRDEFAPERRPWVSVNASAVELQVSGIAATVRADLASVGLPPASLVVEVTETALLGTAPEVENNLHDLAGEGIGLALDDFGTAYSSLEYLLRHPFDHLKLDRSFTAALTRGSRTVHLVESIRRLAADMGATPIAEGIEEPEQRALLMAAGWDLGQGFLYSPAVPEEAATELLRRGSV